jgi:flagellar motor switch protein FliM
MSEQSVLNQDEVDALMTGMKTGAVSIEPVPGAGEVRNFDLGKEARIVRGRMPTLEMINERFARLYRSSLHNMLRRAPTISVGTVQTLKFSDYLPRMQVPTSLNMVRIAPLRGTGLIVLSPQLLCSVVDNYFGGKGRQAKIEGRSFTITENRVIQMLLTQIFADLKEAWSHVMPLNIEIQSSETNPIFVETFSPTEVMVVTIFTIELDGGGGELHVTMPYTMIEPLREVLDSRAPGDSTDNAERWSTSLREEIEDAEVELNAILGRSTVTLAELINLKPGDVIPCDFTGKVTVMAEDVPLFRGGYGTSRGQQAVKVEERLGLTR